MSRPDNPTSGKYFLRSGKSSTTPVRSTFIQPHQSLSDATFNSPGPIICAPTPERQLHFFPRAERSATSTSSSASSSAGDDDTDSSATTDDDDMASTSNSLVPAPFTGRPTEDIHEFLKNFELWTLYRRLSDESSLSALPLLLKDGAAVWWNTQPDTIRVDMRALKAALTERYGICRDEAWKCAAALWTLQQQPHQSTDDFLTHVNQEAQRIYMVDPIFFGDLIITTPFFFTPPANLLIATSSIAACNTLFTFWLAYHLRLTHAAVMGLLDQTHA